MVRALPVRVVLRSCLAILLLLPAACSGDAGPRMNVVVISLDSVRRDHLGPYGKTPRYAPDLAITPHLDALAQEGVVFEDAWSSTSWTLPAHVSLMTGLTSACHGVEDDPFRIDPLHRTLPEAFREAGYATGGAYSGPYLDPKYGFGRGFDVYRSAMLTPEEFAEEVRAHNARRRQAGQEPLSKAQIDQLRDRISHWDITSPKVNGIATDFLDAHGEEPFFLFLHYFDAHYDHLPEEMEEGLGERFDPGYRGPYDGVNWYFNEEVLSWGPDYERRIGERDLHHVMALYEAEIHWVDRHVGAVFDELRARGLWEDTAVVVLSDHGDEFFDHGSIGHRSTLYEELLRIPLIARIPGATRAGERRPELVRIYDLAPTLLDYACGGALPAAQGSSLRPILEGEEGGRESLSSIVAWFNRDGPQRWNWRDAWRDERYTVIRHLAPVPPQDRADPVVGARPMNAPGSSTPYLVFDRDQDPHEQAPLPASDPRSREAIAAFREAMAASRERCAALPASSHRERLAPALSEAERRALDQLGYVAGGEDEGGLQMNELPKAPWPLPQLPR